MHCTCKGEEIPRSTNFSMSEKRARTASSPEPHEPHNHAVNTNEVWCMCCFFDGKSKLCFVRWIRCVQCPLQKALIQIVLIQSQSTCSWWSLQCYHYHHKPAVTVLLTTFTTNLSSAAPHTPITARVHTHFNNAPEPKPHAHGHFTSHPTHHTHTHTHTHTHPHKQLFWQLMTVNNWQSANGPYILIEIAYLALIDNVSCVLRSWTECFPFNCTLLCADTSTSSREPRTSSSKICPKWNPPMPGFRQDTLCVE